MNNSISLNPIKQIRAFFLINKYTTQIIPITSIPHGIITGNSYLEEKNKRKRTNCRSPKRRRAQRINEKKKCGVWA